MSNILHDRFDYKVDYSYKVRIECIYIGNNIMNEWIMNGDNVSNEYGKYIIQHTLVNIGYTLYIV